MGCNLGVIPAAGRAARFGGVLKELLPLPGGFTFIGKACERLSRACSRIAIVTTPEKIAAHAEATRGYGVEFVLQRGNNDIWSAIRTALDIEAERYFFTMPDTLMDDAVFERPHRADFGLGLFHTMTPERFGVLVGGKVVNKQAGLPVPAAAWGVLSWSERVRALWLDNEPRDYTDAINRAMRSLSWETWGIGAYHDNAALADYMALLKGWEEK